MLCCGRLLAECFNLFMIGLLSARRWSLLLLLSMRAVACGLVCSVCVDDAPTRSVKLGAAWTANEIAPLSARPGASPCAAQRLGTAPRKQPVTAGVCLG